MMDGPIGLGAATRRSWPVRGMRGPRTAAQMRSAQREAAGWWPAAPTKGVSSMLRLVPVTLLVLALVFARVALADPAPAPSTDPAASDDPAATSPVLPSPLPS